ncbi:MAG TPA: PH domain-containing protein [Pyrinomonadaceae bacterium]
MHCSNCGSYVAPSVRFCSNCGSQAPDPEVTRLARTNAGLPTSAGRSDLEQVIFTVRPTMIFVKLGYALAVIGAIVLVFLLALVNAPAYISIPLGLALLLIPVYYHIRRNMIRYTLTDAKLEIDSGLIARTTHNIPLNKIQNVTVSASVPQRILRFGNVIVDNAAELDGATVLHNINNPRFYADQLLRELRRWQ